MVRLPLTIVEDLGKTSSPLSLDEYLISIERRAFKITEFAVHDRDEALDIVQNAMFKLVKYYSSQPEHALTLLFYRILQNEIKDWKRKAWLCRLFDFNADTVDSIVDESLESYPDRIMEQKSLNEIIYSAIGQLPFRQQQAFLLRNFEGLDVKETAIAMCCSEGSVKTHYSRAVSFLREKLAGENL